MLQAAQKPSGKHYLFKEDRISAKYVVVELSPRDLTEVNPSLPKKARFPQGLDAFQSGKVPSFTQPLATEGWDQAKDAAELSFHHRLLRYPLLYHAHPQNKAQIRLNHRYRMGHLQIP